MCPRRHRNSRLWVPLLLVPVLAIALGIAGWYARRLEGLCLWGMENVGFLRGYDGKYGTPLNSKPVARRQVLGNSFGQIMCFKDNGSEVALPCATDTVSCTTFNILAPIYKRMDGENARESDFRENWVIRNRNIIKMLLSQNSSIICLQEFWIDNNELVELYEQSLGGAGYDLYMLARTNNRGDGLLTAVQTNLLKVLDHEELAFNDCGDRVAQFMRLQSRIPLHRDVTGRAAALQEVLLVNTHLIFPHNSSYCLVRLRQVYKILKYIEEYKRKHKLWRVPVLLCGDWNGSKRGQVYKFLRSQGFISSYDAAHQYTDSEADAHRWVSHRNHRGNICGVDFIWFLNPSQQQSTLRESWKAAVFGIIKSKLLREHGKEGRDAFCFFQTNDCDNCVTYEDFHAAMTRLELTKEDLDGLTREEIEELIKEADFDGNGVIDYKEFEGRLLLPQENQPLSWSTENSEEEDQDKPPCPELALKAAFFHLPEVEQGTWPEHYSLSDHAPLTAIFSSVLC